MNDFREVGGAEANREDADKAKEVTDSLLNKAAIMSIKLFLPSRTI